MVRGVDYIDSVQVFFSQVAVIYARSGLLYGDNSFLKEESRHPAIIFCVYCSTFVQKINVQYKQLPADGRDLSFTGLNSLFFLRFLLISFGSGFISSDDVVQK